MKPSISYLQHREAIRQIVESHRGTNPRVFGSVLHGHDTETSDLDILVDPTDEMTLFDLGAISIELSELLGVDVDVLTPGSLPERWKMEVLQEAQGTMLSTNLVGRASARHEWLSD
jgi:predicted nucleotidyltransferase